MNTGSARKDRNGSCESRKREREGGEVWKRETRLILISVDQNPHITGSLQYAVGLKCLVRKQAAIVAICTSGEQTLPEDLRWRDIETYGPGFPFHP